MRGRRFAGLWMGLAVALVVALTAFVGGPGLALDRTGVLVAAGADAGRPSAVPSSARATSTPGPIPAPTGGAHALGTAEPLAAQNSVTPSLPPPPPGTPTPISSRQPLTSTPPLTAESPTSTPATSPEAAPTTLRRQPSGPDVIGLSVEGRPLEAYRVGDGPIKVALVGNIHGHYEANTHELALRLLTHFRAHPEEVPASVSLWIVPTMNPDGLATGHRWNAHDVDLNRNADTDLDGCAGNDWTADTAGPEGEHLGAGGPHPFSEPETRAVRGFLADAWVAVFYHSAAGEVYADSCRRHAPSVRLAEVLAEASEYRVPEEGWAGYRITGDLADFLSGEGVAAATVELTDHENPEFERNLEGVRTVLGAVETIVSAEVPNQGGGGVEHPVAGYDWLDESNTGRWGYAAGSFVHPLALEVIDGTAYLLDGGRVLALDLDPTSGPQAPVALLAPGDDVEGVPVLEPLDLAAGGGGVTPFLLVLDRAGDVYRYEVGAGSWSVQRYDRPAGASSSHYYVALAAGSEANYLLETSAEQVWRFAGTDRGAASVALPKSRDVDLGAASGDLYVLVRNLNNPLGSLLKYRGGRPVASFMPDLELLHPRQVVATEGTVYVLDREGRRLLALDPDSGALLALRQFSDRRPMGAVWADLSGDGLILAGRDTLYFVGQPERHGGVGNAEGAVPHGEQVHDPAVLEGLRGMAMPIEGASLTSRDFQLPGAPRHYRLGVHEGIDFYGYTTGVTVNRSTPVRAAGDGTVIRATLDYQPLSPAQAAAWEAAWRRTGSTPPDVLDGYRGRQVWIDHGGGLVSRYAHLGGIAPGIREGAAVSRGEVIGTVGNSGTPASLTSETVEVHLHFELWVGAHYVGQYLRPFETRVWLGRILR